MKNNRKQPILLKYIPHGLNTNIFFPIDPLDKDLVEFKKKLYGNEEFDFVLMFNSRNIRRKQIPDTILAWKLFVDTLPKEKAKKCLLLLKTQIEDANGTDLKAVVDYFAFEDHCKVEFIPQNLNAQEMNHLYNSVDGVILLSSAEGWGLALTESLLTGTPFIANVTGGMQDQMRFEYENGEWIDFDKDFPSNHRGTYKKHGKWAFPIYPNNLSLVGSIPTPYIYDDRCTFEEASEQINNLYKIGDKERKRIGKLGLEWALSDEAGFTSKKMTQRVIESVDYLLEKWKPRENFELYQDSDYKPRILNHKILY